MKLCLLLGWSLNFVKLEALKAFHFFLGDLIYKFSPSFLSKRNSLDLIQTDAFLLKSNFQWATSAGEMSNSFNEAFKSF